jgi:hypothetical protein
MTGSELVLRSLSDIAELIRLKDMSPVQVTRTVLDGLETPKSAPECLPHDFRRRSAGGGDASRARHGKTTPPEVFIFLCAMRIRWGLRQRS